jgi:DNA-binding GntR family transcriptional regulator
VTLSPDDPRPPYLQIADELRRAILQGALAPGAQLPSTSELADRYSAAPNTVRSALRLLREESLIVARQGKGVFVRSTVKQEPVDDTATQVAALTQQLAAVSQDVQRLSDRVAELETLVRHPRESD